MLRNRFLNLPNTRTTSRARVMLIQMKLNLRKLRNHAMENPARPRRNFVLMSRKQSVRAQLLRKLQLCQMKILPSPGFTPKLKAEYIESMVVSEGVGRSQAAEAWNQSSQKRNILSTVSVPELRRRRFIEKGCDHNPWAS